MAKAKKTESKSTEAPAAGKSKAVAAKRKKPAAPASGGGHSMIDTNFAAEAAARMLAARAKVGSAASEATPERESGAFKQLKQGLNKPAGQSAANVLGNALGPNRSNLPIPEKGQSAHSQSMGNVSRVNVPRRTGG